MNIFDDEILRNYSCNNSQANHLPYSTVLYVGVPYILLFIYFRNTQLSRRSHEGEKRESKTVLLTSHGNKERSLLTADPPDARPGETCPPEDGVSICPDE